MWIGKEAGYDRSSYDSGAWGVLAHRFLVAGLCADGMCVPDCDDGDPCTNDFWGPGGNCLHTGRMYCIPCEQDTDCPERWTFLQCRDGHSATEWNGACMSDHTCGMYTWSCDDYEESTVDSCDPSLGCINVPGS